MVCPARRTYPFVLGAIAEPASCIRAVGKAGNRPSTPVELLELPCRTRHGSQIADAVARLFQRRRQGRRNPVVARIIVSTGSAVDPKQGDCCPSATKLRPNMWERPENPIPPNHEPGLIESPTLSSSNPVSRVTPAGRVGATNGGCGSTCQHELDCVTARPVYKS